MVLYCHKYKLISIQYDYLCNFLPQNYKYERKAEILRII